MKRSKPAHCRAQTQNPEQSGQQNQSPCTETAPPGGGPPKSEQPVHAESTKSVKQGGKHSQKRFSFSEVMQFLGFGCIHIKSVHKDNQTVDHPIHLRCGGDGVNQRSCSWSYSGSQSTCIIMNSPLTSLMEFSWTIMYFLSGVEMVFIEHFIEHSTVLKRSPKLNVKPS